GRAGGAGGRARPPREPARRRVPEPAVGPPVHPRPGGEPGRRRAALAARRRARHRLAVTEGARECADSVPVRNGHFRAAAGADTKDERILPTRLETRMRSIRVLFLPLLLALACALPAAQASSPSGLAVSQVFAGGGNSGAPYQNDFVVLLDRGSSSVDLSGWTLQYASAASTSWQVTTLSGTITPGHSYLVQLASTAAVGAVLPAPDATGTTNLANTGGKVALVHDTNALTCGDVAGSCSASPLVADLVGYGAATDYEG